ncbi:MAG: phosphatidate cytidylyltransferase [Muribaculaceae bacterium]
MKKLITRAISGSIYVALIVGALLSGCPWAFLTLFALFSILGVNEFHNLININRLMGDSHRMMRIIDIVGATAIFTAVHLSCRYEALGNIVLIALLAYFILRMVAQLYARPANHLHCLAQSMLAIMYVALPLSVLNLIYFDYGATVLLAAFIFIWLNDTGAYCVGCLFGRHRLFERISPKKSWEGFWGGMAFCIASAWLLHWLDFFPQGWSFAAVVGFAIVTSVFATWGDLCESLIKRTLGVKDSGNIMPGHGGILDRIDSLLLVAPATLLYLLLIAFF